MLCGKDFTDLLKHLRLSHEIDSIEAYALKVSEVAGMSEKRGRFSNYVQELQARMKKGLITGEDYRRLITEWKDK